VHEPVVPELPHLGDFGQVARALRRAISALPSINTLATLLSDLITETASERVEGLLTRRGNLQLEEASQVAEQLDSMIPASRPFTADRTPSCPARSGEVASIAELPESFLRYRRASLDFHGNNQD
jgi:hypothetical protein